MRCHNNYPLLSNIFLYFVTSYSVLTLFLLTTLHFTLLYFTLLCYALLCYVLDSVIYWAHDVIRQAAQASEISTKARANITQHIELLRQTMFLMFSYQELSVPFNYIHLVELLSTIYCPLFAMAVALRGVTHVGMIADVLVIMIVTVFITGVYRIARKLQDAIGGDVEDLSVITTCRECIKLCKVIEQLPTMPIHDPSIERRLELGQEIF